MEKYRVIRVSKNPQFSIEQSIFVVCAFYKIFNKYFRLIFVATSLRKYEKFAKARIEIDQRVRELGNINQAWIVKPPMFVFLTRSTS